MIYEIRVHEAADGRANAMRRRFLDVVAVKFFPRHGIEVIGVFTAPVEDGRLTYITCFANEDAQKKAWAAFAADSEWVAAKATSGADGGYVGDKLYRVLKRIGEWKIQIIKRSDTALGFEVLSRRWVVERTFAWLSRSRRLAKDFEAAIVSAVAWALVAHVSTLSRQLARA